MKVRTLFSLLTALLLAAPPAQAAPGIIYVDGAAPVNPDCGSPTTPCATIQDGVDAARPGDELRVAAGEYTAINDRAGRAQIVYLDKSLTLRGGYPPGDWQHPDPDAHPSVLNAQGRGRALYAAGMITLTLEGLTITGGDASGLGGGRIGEDVGGGLYLLSATATLSGCRILSNTAGYGPESAGGGLYLRYGALHLRDSTLAENAAGKRGGGAYLYDSAVTLSGSRVLSNTAFAAGGGLALHTCAISLTDNTIAHNSANYGGGLVIDKSDVTLAGNTILSNTAGAYGGGVYLGDSAALLEDNHIAQNKALTAGGGIYLANSNAILRGNTLVANEGINTAGGGLGLRSGEITLERNAFTANVTEGDGGGLSLAYARAMLLGNAIAGNIAYHGGGGLFAGSSDVSLEGNRIANNTAYLVGGGLRLTNSDVSLQNDLVVNNLVALATNGGSGIHAVQSSLRLQHTTWARNRGGDGSALHIEGLSGPLLLTNTLLVGHTIGITLAAGNRITLEATLWGAGSWANGADWAGAGTVVSGTRNIWGDPAFVEAEGGNYHIMASSAARDAGVDAGVGRDMDGQPRPIGPAPDLGADEFCYQTFSPLALKGVRGQCAAPRRPDSR